MNVTEALYPTCWVLTPLPLHHIIPIPMPCPSSLASPTAAFVGMHIRINFLFSFFLFLFCPMLQRPSLPHMLGSKTPTSPPHNTHPCALPLKPCKSCHCICGYTSKDKFFSFPFFVSFLTNVTETLFTPYAGSENPFLSTT